MNKVKISSILLAGIFLFSLLTGFNNIKIVNPDQPAFVKDFLGQVEFIQGRLLQLENEFPQEKMDWRPAEGIRSVAEVFLHVAEANYFLTSKFGGTAAEVDMKTSDKGKIAEILKTSFDAVKSVTANVTEEDLNKTMEVFGREMTYRNFMISILNHAHEHLGQEIAYARMNGVVPPWSKKEN